MSFRIFSLLVFSAGLSLAISGCGVKDFNFNGIAQQLEAALPQIPNTLPSPNPSMIPNQGTVTHPTEPTGTATPAPTPTTGLATPTPPPCLSGLTLTAGMAVFPSKSLLLNGNDTIKGDVMLLGANPLELAGGSAITGNVLIDTHDTGFRDLVIGNSVPPSVVKTSLAGVQAAITTTFQNARAMAATQALAMDPIDGMNDVTLSSTGAMNVVNVKTDLTINGGSTLTLHGGADDIFVINVGGNLILNGGAAIAVSGGVTPQHVLITVGDQLILNGNADAVGTYINAASLTVNGNSAATGAILSEGNAILNGNSTLNLKPAAYCPVPMGQ